MVTEDEARRLLDDCFGTGREREVKHSRLARTKRGRAQLLELQYPGTDFVLLHDASKMIQRNRKRWEIILDPTNPAAKVGQDRRTIEFPLPVRSLHLVDSRSYPQLQVADLVAGAASALMSARARSRTTEYSQALMDVGLLNAVRGGVWPSAAISPEQLETDGPVLGDAADFIAQLVHHWSAGLGGSGRP